MVFALDALQRRFNPSTSSALAACSITVYPSSRILSAWD